jgi:hypothetical protein
MLWSEVLVSLSDEGAARLVNGLSIGLGATALAGRRAARDASLGAVERSLAAAHDALARSLAELPAALRLPGNDSHPRLVSAEPRVPTLSWTDYVLQWDADPGQAPQVLLADAVRGAREAGEAFLADGEAEATLDNLREVRRVLASLHDRLTHAMY